eukprot:tig00021489_g21661.t1
MAFVPGGIPAASRCGAPSVGSAACSLAGRPVARGEDDRGDGRMRTRFEADDIVASSSFGLQAGERARDPPRPAVTARETADAPPSVLRVNWEDFFDKRMGRGEVFYGKSKKRIAAELAEMGYDLDAEKEPIPDEERRQGATLVVGATGGVGQWVALKLLNRGVPVRVLVRSKAGAEGIFGPDGDNLDIFQGDLADPRSVRRAVAGCEAVVIASGARSPLGANRPEKVDYEGVKSIVAACKEAGTVKHVTLVSSLGTTRPEKFPLYTLFGDVLRWKRKAEEELAASGLPYTIIRPGGLRDEPGGLREMVLERGDALPTGSISRMDVAELAVECAVARYPSLDFACLNGPGFAAGYAEGLEEEEEGEDGEEGYEPGPSPMAEPLARLAGAAP